MSIHVYMCMRYVYTCISVHKLDYFVMVYIPLPVHSFHGYILKLQVLLRYDIAIIG